MTATTYAFDPTTREWDLGTETKRHKPFKSTKLGKPITWAVAGPVVASSHLVEAAQAAVAKVNRGQKSLRSRVVAKVRNRHESELYMMAREVFIFTFVFMGAYLLAFALFIGILVLCGL